MPTNITARVKNWHISPESSREEGAAALSLAVRENHYSVARLLSESGADGHRMLLELLSQQNFEMADCLMAGGPRMTRIEDPRIQSALEIVVKYHATKK